jgi:hypothetical protein
MLTVRCGAHQVTVILHMAATTRFTEHIQVGLLVTLFFFFFFTVSRLWRQSIVSRVAAAAVVARVQLAIQMNALGGLRVLRLAKQCARLRAHGTPPPPPQGPAGRHQPFHTFLRVRSCVCVRGCAVVSLVVSCRVFSVHVSTCYVNCTLSGPPGSDPREIDETIYPIRTLMQYHLLSFFVLSPLSFFSPGHDR